MSSLPQDRTRSRPLLLGHRGARRHAPENTLAAFDLALAHGCDGFEFDVRLTADGVPVIFHDEKLSGMAIAGSRYDNLAERWEKAVSKLKRVPFAAEDCALTHLEAILERYAPKAFLDIELKVGGLESITVAALRRWPPARGFYVSSFLPDVLERLHALDPDIPLGLICDREVQLARCQKLPLGALFLHRRLTTKQTVVDAHAAGKQVFVWTVNEAAEMRRLADMRVEGLISDDTALLAETLTIPCAQTT